MLNNQLQHQLKLVAKSDYTLVIGFLESLIESVADVRYKIYDADEKTVGTRMALVTILQEQINEIKRIRKDLEATKETVEE